MKEALIGDHVTTIGQGIILAGEGDPDMDVSGDGEVNIADVNAIISIILQGNN